jgi:SAM-dependent methyltransferase
MNISKFEDIDWATLYRLAREEKSWKSKSAAEWDKKAAGFAKRTRDSIYTDHFIRLLAPDPQWSVLDIGCGPGTLSLPLSPLVGRITAIDYSQGMLDVLAEKISEDNIKNITSHCLSWTDDWQQSDIGVHDVAIASRSLAVHDLGLALEKLNCYAVQRVCLTDRVGHGPFDPEAFAAIGRPLSTGPDYIYTINILYQMSIRAELEFIRLEEELCFPTLEDAVASYAWMFRDLNGQEKKLLAEYVASMVIVSNEQEVIIRRRHVPTWAFISWHPRGS